jgi:uracil-DNA glycosylase family 4
MKPDSCISCPLYSHGHDFTAVEGNGASGVMLVGEASGEMEARDSLPFRGYAPAGSVLERCLRRLGLDRSTLTITNCLRCHPRGNLLDAKWESAAVAHCSPNLFAAISRAQPRVILALGSTAFAYLTGLGGPGQTVTTQRGYAFPLTPAYAAAISPDAAPCVVIPTYHPSHIRRGLPELGIVLTRDMQRAVNVASGKDSAYWIGDPLNFPSLDYHLSPRIDEADSWFERVRDAGNSACIAYDLETIESPSLEDDAIDKFSDTNIIQIQFSHDLAGTIVLEWANRFFSIIHAILHLPNPKCAHNGRAFDSRILEAASARDCLLPNYYSPLGTLHDTLQMWRWWQPDLPGNLQYAASFLPFPFAWKHLGGETGFLPFYGAVDADATLRLYHYLPDVMRRDRVWDSADGQGGYVNQVVRADAALTQMTRNGIATSPAARERIKGEISAAQDRLAAAMQSQYPDTLKSLSPRDGYKLTPPRVKAADREYDNAINGALIATETADAPPEALRDVNTYAAWRTGLTLRPFRVTVSVKGVPHEEVVPRWCQVEPFNPASRDQIARLIDQRAWKMPDKLGLPELQRLRDVTRDPLLRNICQWRENEETRRELAALPVAADGRIYPAYVIAPEIAASPREPKLPADPRLRPVIAADPGRVIVEWRMARPAWLVMLAAAAKDAAFSADVLAGKVDTLAYSLIEGRSNRWLMDELRGTLGKTPTMTLTVNRLALSKRWAILFAYLESQRALANGPTASLVSRYGSLRRFAEVYAPDGHGGWKPGEQYSDATRFLPHADAAGRARVLLARLAEAGIAEEGGLFYADNDCMAFNMPDERVGELMEKVQAVLNPEEAGWSWTVKLCGERWEAR